MLEHTEARTETKEDPTMLEHTEARTETKEDPTKLEHTEARTGTKEDPSMLEYTEARTETKEIPQCWNIKNVQRVLGRGVCNNLLLAMPPSGMIPLFKYSAWEMIGSQTPLS